MLIERCEKDAVKKLKRCVEDVLKIPGFVYRVCAILNQSLSVREARLLRIQVFHCGEKKRP